MKHILNILILAIVLFLCAALGYNLMQMIYSGPSASSSAYQFPAFMILIILAAEILRAIPTYWLYLHHSERKKQIGHSIFFGLVCCFLVGSLYVFLAPFEFPIENKQRYMINGLVIFTMQGIASGYVLWLMLFWFGKANN